VEHGTPPLGAGPLDSYWVKRSPTKTYPCSRARVKSLVSLDKAVDNAVSGLPACEDAFIGTRLDPQAEANSLLKPRQHPRSSMTSSILVGSGLRVGNHRSVRSSPIAGFKLL
jgi:hypothetical protein